MWVGRRRGGMGCRLIVIQSELPLNSLLKWTVIDSDLG